MFVHTLGLKSREEWKKYYKSGKTFAGIPLSPESIYKNEWKGWGDWLGSGNIAPSDRKFRPFPEAREFVHTLGLKSVEEWGVYRRSGKKPKDIPADPYSSYKGKGWTWMGDWLGTGRVRNQSYRQFIQARKFVHTLALKNQEEWQAYNRSGKKPKDIPADPYYAYNGKGWESWGDWLGTDSIASYNREFRGFAKAKEFVRKLGFANRKQWAKYSISGNRPKDIPSNPDKIYKREWQGWGIGLVLVLLQLTNVST